MFRWNNRGMAGKLSGAPGDRRTNPFCGSLPNGMLPTYKKAGLILDQFNSRN